MPNVLLLSSYYQYKMQKTVIQKLNISPRYLYICISYISGVSFWLSLSVVMLPDPFRGMGALRNCIETQQ